MPILEYDYNQNDYQLVATQSEGEFGSTGDYIRLIVYKDNSIVNIEDEVSSQAIFYSSLSEKEPLNYLEKVNKLTEIKEFILRCIIISILVGFLLYFKKQYRDHYKKWSTSKFIFGIRNCNSMK